MTDNPLKLIFLGGERSGEEILLSEGETTLGRSRSNTIVVDDPLVSRKHLQLRIAGGDVMTQDLESSDGTLLNDKRLRGAVSLAHGDVLQLGNTKLRFVSEREPDKDSETVIAPSGGTEHEDEGTGKTRFASEDDASETRYEVPPERPPDDEEDDEGTHVFDQQETRMLESAELAGLRSGKPKSTSLVQKPVIGFSILVMAVLAGTLYFVTHESSSSSVSGDVKTKRYHDEQFEFSLSCPVSWIRAPDPETALVSFQLRDSSRKVVAYIDHYADKNIQHSLTGLTMGFEAYLDTLESRHPGFLTSGSMPMRIKETRVMFYAFKANERRGKGIYVLTGNTRIVIECSCLPSHWPALKKAFTGILKSFRLDEPQQVIDFPKPDEKLRRMALADPERLKELAETRLKVGEDLLKRRNVRPENLYRAIEKCRECLQMASAFITRPAFYDKAARNLVYARTLFKEAVRDQKFAIKVASKQRNRERVYWEAYKLMQMIPDKTDPVHQYAYRMTKKFAEKK